MRTHQIDSMRFIQKNIVMVSDHSADAASRPEGTRRGGLAQHGCVLAHSMGLRIIMQIICYSLMMSNEARLAMLRSWNSHGGMLIMGHVGFRELMQYVFTSGTSAFNTVAGSLAVEQHGSSIVQHQLLQKVEYVISCPLTGIRQELYCRYLAAFLGIGLDGSSSMNIFGNEKLFQHGMLLATICNHPAVCRKMLEDHHHQKDKANHHHENSNMVASESNDSGHMDLLAIED
ncbi:hypothetical protein COEREDRAFT_12689 [Coemansia reversa NRRL 1564]|uniref:Uncharacterized protein n=1 Tax=Coemansia reversa (strain ATCC 12441 / NRRL 1564) TaxID=763665 RepID=A0A2G5B0G9_COERN|nr:hypothetical protein COEREDRAFT_12689 [Coemansia reversa NRRL 1564]|eukprot:PIA12511.1 hypothetical protein COEREDRAFT_12689 [Coemansia reversa NRRL 1564]